MSPKLRKAIEKTIKFLETHDWCVGHLAKDSTGKPVPVDSKQAKAFCLAGAFYRANSFTKCKNPTYIEFWLEFSKQFNTNVVTFNDDKAHGKHRVIGKLKRMLKTTSKS